MKERKLIGLGIVSVFALMAVCFCVFAAPNLNTTKNGQNDGSNNALINEVQTNTLPPAKKALNKSESSASSVVVTSTVSSVETSSNKKSQNSIETTQEKVAQDSDNDMRMANVYDFNTKSSVISTFENIVNPIIKYNANAQEIYYNLDAEGNLQIGAYSDEHSKWSHFNSSSLKPGWFDKRFKVKSVEVLDELAPACTKAWFGCSDQIISGQIQLMNITSFSGLSKIDMDNVEDGSFMFAGCNIINSCDGVPTNIHPKNACSICHYTMFSNAILNTIATSLATSNSIDDTSYAFSKNSQLTSFGASGMKFNTKKADYMFYKDTNLTSITADNLIDNGNKSVSSVEGMFNNCALLKNINLAPNTDWKNNVDSTDSELFIECISLPAFKPTNTGLDYANNGDKGYFGPKIAPKYNITVNTDGHGSAHASCEKAAEGETVELFIETCEEGYQFSAWQTASGIFITTDNKFLMPADNVTITATFRPKQCLVIFKENGHGTANPLFKSVTYGQTYGDLATFNTVEGYTFKGWYTDSACTGDEVKSTTEVTTYNNHVLYAKWVPGWTINFNDQSDNMSFIGYKSTDPKTKRFTPATVEEGNPTITYSTTASTEYFGISGNNLTIKPSTPANEYKFTITATADADESHTATSKTINFTLNIPVHPVDYAVCIWNIEGKDGEGTQTITFGPATGSTYDKAIGGATQISDSWDEIKANAQNGCAHAKYDEALNNGWIKIITLDLNNTLYSNTPSTYAASVLINSINKNYRKWNNDSSGTTTEDPAAQYGTSRIRATLNGYDPDDPESWKPSEKYAGENCLTYDNCLLSCFPGDLKNIIKAKTFQSAKTWSNSSPYKINSSEIVTDKLWPANAREIFNDTGDMQFLDYGNVVHKYLDTNVSKIAYTESGNKEGWWLRSPCREFFFDAGYVYSEGILKNYTVKSPYNGLAPCFCL